MIKRYDKLKTIAWICHGPYSEGEETKFTETDPCDDDTWSALCFVDDIAPLEAKAAMFDEAKLALQLFVAYDDSDMSSVDCMMKYAEAIEAARDLLTRARAMEG